MGDFPASWFLLPVSEAVRNITITDKKIPQKNYLPSGKFPVFDQGQDYVGGYTNDAAMVVDCELPAIVFGDHTRVVKLVSAAFAPGADGVKVLQPSACILPALLEHFVRYLVTKIPNNGYARHYQYLAKSLLPIPPLAEQHRIVAKIEELFSELDQGVASLKTAREQLKVYRQSLLKNAFEGKLTATWRAEHRDQIEPAAALQQRIAHEREARYQQQLADWQNQCKPGPKPKPPKPLPPLTPEELAELPELPEGWGWFKVNHLCDVVRGGSPRPAGDPKYYGGDIPFLKVADITRNPSPYLSTYSFTITEAGLNKTRQIEPNTLLLSNSGATLGVPKICLISATMNDGVAAFLGLPGHELLYHYYFWQSQTEKLRNIDQGAAQPNLNTDLIKETPIPICSSAEQSIVTERLEAALSEADQLDQTLATALQQADALRQSILKKAFCGQLVKQDKNDEPATALLERIRAARAASPAKSRQVKLGSKPLPNC
jgi:type I restriction enzyme S subunit